MSSKPRHQRAQTEGKIGASKIHETEDRKGRSAGEEQKFFFPVGSKTGFRVCLREIDNENEIERVAGSAFFFYLGGGV